MAKAGAILKAILAQATIKVAAPGVAKTLAATLIDVAQEDTKDTEDITTVGDREARHSA